MNAWQLTTLNSIFQVGALKISLESSYKELADTRRQLAENSVAEHEENLLKEQEARKAVEEKLRLTVDQNRTEVTGLYKQIDELRVALSRCVGHHTHYLDPFIVLLPIFI